MEKLTEYLVEGIKGLKEKYKYLIYFVLFSFGIVGVGLFLYSFSIKENSEFASTIANNSLFILAIFFISSLLLLAETGKEKIDTEKLYILTSEEKEQAKDSVDNTKLIALEDDTIHKSPKYDESYSSLGHFKSNDSIYLGISKFINNGKTTYDNKPIKFSMIKENDIISAYYLWVDDKKKIETISNKLKDELNKGKYTVVKVKNSRNIFIVSENGFKSKGVKDLIIKINECLV